MNMDWHRIVSAYLMGLNTGVGLWAMATGHLLFWVICFGLACVCSFDVVREERQHAP